MVSTTWCSFLGDSSFANAVSLLGVRTMNTFGMLGTSGPRLGSTLDPRMLARWVEARTGRRAGETAPDLGALLDERGFAGPAREDLRRFEGLVASCAGEPAARVVGRCVADDRGSFAVAVYSAGRPGPTVRVGDRFFAGVQLSGHLGSGVVLVEPHVLRRVCVNGATAHVATDAGVYARWDADSVEGDLETVIELGFSGALVGDVESDLRRAATTPLPRLSDLRARGLLRIDDALAASILDAARHEEPTLYGLYNAMTRVARDTSDMRTAIAPERAAGRLVATLVRAPDRDLTSYSVPAGV